MYTCRHTFAKRTLSGYYTGKPVTNRGLPRTVPEVDPKVAELIRKHARLHLDGMPLKEGWRRWLAARGPCDPRSTTGRMSYNAYRSNPIRQLQRSVG